MRYLTTICFMFCIWFFAGAQNNSLQFSEQTRQDFAPYMYYRHGGVEGLESFKKDHPHDYLKELWYYAESFYIRKNVHKEGSPLEKKYLDVSRFEQYRKDDEEATVTLPGYADEMVLLPVSKLIYKP